MSLINDALKKAQRQRTEGSTPATEVSTPGESQTQEPLQRVARRAKPVGFRSQLILIGGGAAAAVLLLGIGAFFLFRPSAEPAAPAALPTKVAAQAAAPAVVAAAPTPAAPAAALPTPTPPAAATPAPSAAPVAVVAAPAPQPAPVETPAPTPAASAPVAYSIPTPAATASASVATPAPTTAPAAAERPKASTRMIGVIEHMKVGGIRVSGAESKVLMNDRVYRINDVVDFELGIRLTGIEAKALTFEDARGAVHVRTF